MVTRNLNNHILKLDMAKEIAKILGIALNEDTLKQYVS